MREASPSRDWYDWHQGYEPDSGSHLVRRLEVVQELVGRALDAIGCMSINFVDPADDKFTVGLERFDGAAVPFEPSWRLFDFVGFDRLIAQGE